MYHYTHSMFSGWHIGFSVVMLVVFILFLITLFNVLNAVSPANRKLEPGLVFLLLIPIFNMGWIFFVVIKLRDSLQAEYQARDLQGDGFAYGLGLALSILLVCMYIPILNFLAFIPWFICWIVYWVKMSGYRSTLEASGPSS